MSPEPWTPIARLQVTNDSDDMLRLTMEPEASDQWLRPGETFFVIKAGDEEELTQDTEAAPRQDFYVYYHGPAWVMVYARGVAWVEDEEGKTIECGHQRPTS